MPSWRDGYVTEVDYPNNYHGALVPAQIAFAALVQGLITPAWVGHGPRVLELGCGPGLTANIIAAGNPDTEYTAVDFNASHIARARALAAAAGSANVHFLEASFEDIAGRGDLGPFDIVSLHGVYTWVSAANREHIVRIAREKLAPGGLVYISYNTFPGWAPIIPIQNLFLLMARQHADRPILERLREGFKAYRQLAKVAAGSITANAGIVPHMLATEVADPTYVAHELLNENWKIFHFSEVAADMARAGVTFAASARPLDAIAALNFTDEQATLLAETSDPVLRETLKDQIVNRYFRADLFAAAPTRATEAERRAAWLEQRFVRTATPGPLDAETAGAVTKAGIAPEIADALFAALADGTSTLAELLANASLRDDDWSVAALLMTVLVGYGVCQPARGPAHDTERRARADALNWAILDQVARGADLPYLVSPLTGAAIKLPRLDLYALVADGVAPGERAAVVADLIARFGRGGRRRSAGETVPESSDVQDILRRFEAVTRPRLARLGIGVAEGRSPLRTQSSARMP